MNEQQFLLQKFREFYEKNFIEEPPEIDRREFGFGDFNVKIIQRHLDFQNYSELNSFLRENTPFYISYSGAYYKFPSRKPMNKKELLKADLFYEFDADDIETKCKEEHDSWQCRECSEKGKGRVSECFKCSGNSIELDEWVCSECLGEAKKQTFQLIDFLENDFNLSEGIAVNFSGSKGFHVHVRSEAVQSLSANARIELVDYLTLNGLDLADHGFLKEGKSWLAPKNPLGLSKRIQKELIDFFNSVSADEFAVAINSTSRNAKNILKEKEKIVNEIERGILIPLISSPKKNDDAWSRILFFAAEKLKLNLDRQTSIDLHKILRVPETIHGGTGLIAKKLSIEELKKFNPLNDAVAFNGSEAKEVKLELKETPKFYFNDSFHELAPGKAMVSLDLAVYLLAKKKAKLI